MSGVLNVLLQYYFLIFFIKTYVVGTCLNCLDKVESIQMSSHNICFYKEVDKSKLTVI